MTYDPNFPSDPSEGLADSQPDFLTNFKSLYDVFAVNHIALDAGATAGSHRIIQMLQQEGSPQTNVGEVSVYTKNVDGQTDQVFIRFQGNQEEIQLTNYQIYSISPTKTQTAYFTFLPGKIIVYFGEFTKLKNNLLVLRPPVARRIISASFCPKGSTPKNKPKITTPAPPENGFYSSLNVTGTDGFVDIVAPDCYYMVTANF